MLKALTCVLLFSAVSAHAEAAPAGMKEFNKTCPAKELCPRIEQAYQKCANQNSAPDCQDFVRLFRELLPLYDCQRPFDHSGGEDYIVPAVWLCDGRRGGGYPQEFESYAGLLSGLKSADAKKLFASKEFRNVLDGAVAEDYLDRSLQAEREMRGEPKGQALAFLEDRCENTGKGYVYAPIVRVSFLKQVGPWEPVTGSKEFNKWTVLERGRSVGQVASRDNEKYYRSMDVGAQQAGDLPETVFKGKRDLQFSGWAGCAVFKPVVLSAFEPKADKEGWKKVSTSIKLTEGIFSVIKQNVRELFRETDAGNVLFDYKIGDLYAAEQYSSNAKRNIVAFRFKPDSGAKDIVGESSEAFYWVSVSSGTAPQFLGAGLQLIDFADYDSDGATEFLFWLSGYNLDGYKIFWNGFKDSETFSWKYH
ncbi:MAG: hypothetical protein PHV33_11985 [Elusimicrobiales bacterium]|nr:hypothetical protein [Elusimicrobiales bacterium]